MDFAIANVLAITVISYLITSVFKNTPIDNKWLPIVAGSSGMILGILALMIGMPDFPAEDLINAAAIGIASGLAATGVDQIYKQLTNK